MNMPLKTIIVEDEELSLQRLLSLLTKFDTIEIIGTARNGHDAVALINTKKPDIVFLDIELPGYNGFQVLQYLHSMPKIVFVTAYDQYAVEAFEKNCIDYILKPFSNERLEKTITKLLQSTQNETTQLLEGIAQILERQKRKNHFAIKEGDDILIISVEDIFYFMAEEKYVFLCTYDREYYYNLTLKELEETLDPERFCRIHKSYIVAIDKIQKLHKIFLNEYQVVLKDKKETPIKVSRNYLPVLKQQLRISEMG